METEVIIIGAGVAGLAAAKELTKRGISYIVVEASHRIGGRGYTEKIGPNAWLDLGCAYMVYGPNAQTDREESNPFIQYARNQKFEIEKYDYDGHFVYNGKQISVAEDKQREAFYKDCSDAIRNIALNSPDQPISDIIDLDSPYAVPYMDMMAVTAPADLDEASAQDFHNKVDEHEDYVSRRGYGYIIAHWGSEIPVSLNTKVECVNWSGPGVTVETPKGTIKAQKLITTVSNGILAGQHIEFKPKLPDWKMEAIQGMPMGAENKIGVHFTKDVFGVDDCGYYQTWSDDAQGAYVSANLMASNVVSVFMGGRFSKWMEKQGQDTCHAFAVDRIADIFGNDIRKAVGRSIVTAWVTDPWTLGSYAFALPGHYRKRKMLPLPIDEKLFFAGEATAKCNGTVHGAYWSGVRAAKEVKEALMYKIERKSA